MSKGLYDKKDIYIIKNDINNKVYVGQSVNMKERWAKYRTEVKNRPDNQVITKAMKKYGIEHFWMECLEEQVEDYDEREKYWIQFYNCQIPNGYNIAPGGIGNGSGINCIASKITSQEELTQIYNELKENKQTLTEIAKKHNIGITTIIDINKGRYYHNNNLSYPIRPIHQNYYSEELIKQLSYSLKYETDKTLQEIADEYNIDSGQLSEINTGQRYHREWLEYPIRKSKEKKMEELAPLIIQDLQKTDLSQKEIAIKYNISANSVTNINLGRVWVNPTIDYPIRQNGQNNKQNQKFLDRTQLKEIINLLDSTEISLRNIAKTYNVSVGVIQGINNGTTKKYRLNNIEYPVRKK